MAVKRQTGRSYVQSAQIAFTFTELGAAVVAAGGAIQEVFGLPPNARVVGGEVVVDTAWVGPTAATLDIGDGADPNRYTSSAVNLKTLGRTALTLTGFKYAEADTIDFDPVLTVAAATAGNAYVRVEYVVEGAAHEVQE